MASKPEKRVGSYRVGVVLALLAALQACGGDSRQLPMQQASALVNGTIKIGMSRGEATLSIGLALPIARRLMETLNSSFTTHHT